MILYTGINLAYQRSQRGALKWSAGSLFGYKARTDTVAVVSVQVQVEKK